MIDEVQQRIEKAQAISKDIYNNLIGKNPDLFEDFILFAIASKQLSARQDYYFSSYWNYYGNRKFKQPDIQLENVIISFSDIWAYRHGNNIGFHDEIGEFVRLICAYDYCDNNLNHGGGRTVGFSFPINGFIGIPKTLEEYKTYSKLIRI